MGTPTKSTVEPVKAAVKVPESSLRTRPSLMSASEMRRLRQTVTNGSRFLDRTLKQWLAGLEPEQRERTIDTVYHMLCETNAETLHELKENRFSRALALLRSAKGLDEDTRKLLVHAAGVFFRSAGRSLKQARVPDEQES